MFRLEKRIVRKVALLGLLVCCTIFLGGWGADKVAKPGESAPEITVLDLGDKPVKLSDFKGKVVILRFWTSGCKMCIAGMPVLDDFYKKNKDRGLVVLAVNKGDTREQIEKFVRELKISYPVLLDPLSITAQKYKVKAAPVTFFVDRGGVLQKRVFGETSRDSLEKTLGGLL